MSAEHERDGYRLPATRMRGWESILPRWVLRWRLRATEASIARVEIELAREFGVLETAPLHRELEALMAERESLRARLVELG